jgi:hypothetical protein
MKFLFYLMIVILSSLSNYCFSQNTSSILYNENRELKSDTTISLNNEQFEIWDNIEEDLLSNFLNQFETPQFFLDAGLSFSWILSFQFDNDLKKFVNIKIYKSLHQEGMPKLKTQNQNLIQSVNNALNNLKYGAITHKMKNNKSSFTYYIPVILEIQKVSDSIDENSVLKLNSTSPAFFK